MIKQEERLGSEFPVELRELYFQIGFGVLGVNNSEFLNMIMRPSYVVDFILGEGIFEGNGYRNDIDLKTKLVFFDTGDSVYLCLDLDKKNNKGICPVVYSSNREYVCMAESLEEFLKEMDIMPDYYDELW